MRQFVASSASAPPDAWPAGDARPTAARWIAADLTRVEEQLALDEALLEEAHAGRMVRPVVRTWMATEPTVVVGSSSRIDEEVDRAACGRAGARIVRRPSGGLTVILGPGCVMWSVVAPLSPERQPPIARLHAALLDPLAAALVAAGRPVVRRGSSDLAVRVGDGERKVSGNALRVRRGAVLYHGTLLDDFDLELVSRLLRHPPREPDYRAGRHHAAFLANLSLGRAALDEAVRQAFAAREPLTAWPADRVAELARDRYDSTAWTERTG
ncbi:MAG: biotin/lipoate A/B protein ligase family protein [Planctomycetota bacterium]